MTLYDSNHGGSTAVASNETPGSLQAEIQDRFERLGKLKTQYFDVFDNEEQKQAPKVSRDEDAQSLSSVSSWFDDSWSDLQNFAQIKWNADFNNSKKDSLKRSESTPEHWHGKALVQRPRAGSISKQKRKKSVGSGMHTRERRNTTPGASGNGNVVWKASKPKDKTSKIKATVSSGDLKRRSHRRRNSRDSLDDLADLRFDVHSLLRQPRPIRKTRSGDAGYPSSLRQAQSVGNLVKQQSNRSLQSGKLSKLDLKRSNHASSGQSTRTSRSSNSMVDRSCKSHSLRRRSAMQAPTSPDLSTKMKRFSSMLDMSSKSSSMMDMGKQYLRPLDRSTNGPSMMDMSKSSSMVDMSKSSSRRRRASRRTSSGSGSSGTQRKAAQQRQQQRENRASAPGMTMSSPPFGNTDHPHGSRRSTLTGSRRKGSRRALVDQSFPNTKEGMIQKLENKERACRPSALAMDFSTDFVVRSSA